MQISRLTDLEGIAVHGEDGSRLGHVFEIRSRGAAETEPSVDGRAVDVLLCGRLGLFERLGWQEADALMVPWDAVLRLDGKGLVVRGSRDDYRRI